MNSYQWEVVGQSNDSNHKGINKSRKMGGEWKNEAPNTLHQWVHALSVSADLKICRSYQR